MNAIQLGSFLLQVSKFVLAKAGIKGLRGWAELCSTSHSSWFCSLFWEASGYKAAVANNSVVVYEFCQHSVFNAGVRAVSLVQAFFQGRDWNWRHIGTCGRPKLSFSWISSWWLIHLERREIEAGCPAFSPAFIMCFFLGFLLLRIGNNFKGVFFFLSLHFCVASHFLKPA